jgi:hypothetical protein
VGDIRSGLTIVIIAITVMLTTVIPAILVMFITVIQVIQAIQVIITIPVITAISETNARCIAGAYWLCKGI